MSNTRRVPMSAKAFTATLNSPWRGLASDLNRTVGVNYNVPELDFKEINYQLFAKKLMQAQAEDRVKARSAMAGMKDLYDYTDPAKPSTDGIMAGAVIGMLTAATVSGKQYGRLSPEVKGKLNEIFMDQQSLQNAGEDPVKQQGGLLNRVFDVLSRFEYAGATNEHRNAAGKLTLAESLGMGPRMVLDPIKQTLAGNETSEQQHFDYLVSHKAELKDTLARIDSGELLWPMGTDELKEELRRTNFELELKYGGGSHLPTPSGKRRKPTYSRPEGDYETIYESQRWKDVTSGKVDVDPVPGVIPTSSKEAKDWWAGFSGKSKRTYADNLVQDKGYSPGKAFAQGIAEAILLDPTTYLTGGIAKGGASVGTKAIGMGRVTNKLIEFKDLAHTDDILRLLEPGLKGTKLRLLGKEFVVGKHTSEDLSKIIAGGERNAAKLSVPKISLQQNRVLREMTVQVDEAIKTKYKALHDEMMGLKKAIRNANDPITIERQLVNISNRAAAMNIDRAVVDQLEELVRRGDILDVPQPKPRVPAGSTLDDLDDVTFEAVTTTKAARSRFLAEQTRSLVRATEKLPTKKALQASRNTRPLVKTAKSVMTFSALSKVPLARMVDEVVALARENLPALKEAWNKYDDYLRTYGDDPARILTVEDVASSPSLMRNGLVSPEVRAVLPLFEVTGKISDSPLFKMFKTMGYSDVEATYVVQKYRAAMAQSLNRTLSNYDGIRLADTPLDWSEVRAARMANGIQLDGVIKAVKAERMEVSNNLAEFMAESALDLAAKAGTKNALEIRVAGVPVVHLTKPETLNKAFGVFLKGDSQISKSIAASRENLASKFRGYSSLGAELNHARTSTIGAGEQVINSTLGYLHNLWLGVPPRKQHEIFDLWVTGSTPESLEKWGSQLASLDETFADLQAYLPGIMRQPELSKISTEDVANMLNHWMPEHFHVDAKVMNLIKNRSTKDLYSPDWWKDYYSYKLVKGTRGKGPVGPSALELTWQMRVSMEKAIARSNLIDNVEATWGLHKADIDKDSAAWKVLTSGPDPWRPLPEFNQDVYFPPDLHDPITDLMKMVNNRSTTEVAFGKISRMGQFWKAAVTVYNIPEYFVRNALSDGHMMFYANVNPRNMGKGIKVLANTAKYQKLMRQNPEFARAFVMADGNNKESLQSALSLADDAYNPRESATAISFSKGFKDDLGAPVESLTDAQILKYYFEYGLETNFVRTSLGAVKQLSPRMAKYIGDPIKVANSYGEDARRLSMFIDGLEKAERAGIKDLDEALNFASEKVRRYLFDYTDFSNWERNVVGRAVPFYKWTRKAVPLLTEMLFLKPGKVAVPIKAQSEYTSAVGAQSPDGDVNYPWIATADAIIPSWMRLNPMIYLGDTEGMDETHGTYGLFPNPFAEVTSRIVDPIVPGDETIDPTATPTERIGKYVQGLGSMAFTQLSPGIRAPVELTIGQQAFGSNELGWRPIEDRADYLTGMFPQVRKVQEIPETDVTDLKDILSVLGVMNVQENDPNKQMSELMFLQQIIRTAKERAEQKRLQELGISGG